MSSEGSGKVLSLITQQRRLRHLFTIAARNLVRTANADEISKEFTYFTLHLSEDSESFYTSEHIKGSLNPTWGNFSVNEMKLKGTQTSASNFIIRIWRGKPDDFRLIIEWNVDLFGLAYIAPGFHSKNIHVGSNALLFGLRSGVFGTPTAEYPAPSQEFTECIHKVELSQVRPSYSSPLLSRIHTVQRAIYQTRSEVSKQRLVIEDHLKCSALVDKKKCLKENLQMRIQQLKFEMEWQRSHLVTLKEKLETKRAVRHHRDMDLKTKFETLQKDKDRLHEKKKAYFDVREEFIKTGAHLFLRRKQLISELAIIYPIAEGEGVGDYTICDVKLPNSEDFGGHDETMVAISLGFTCHLLIMISQLLDVPLRYDIDHSGSRSKIIDHIHPQLTLKEREFPLFSKGQESWRFDYGVYLLNRTIGQLRYYCSLNTTDLRLTLPNIKSLLELRFRVKFASEPASHNMMPGQHIPIPPNLGGPQKLTSRVTPAAVDQQKTSQTVQQRSSSSIIPTPSISSFDKSTESGQKSDEEMFKPSMEDDFFKTGLSSLSSTISSPGNGLLDNNYESQVSTDEIERVTGVTSKLTHSRNISEPSLSANFKYWNNSAMAYSRHIAQCDDNDDDDFNYDATFKRQNENSDPWEERPAMTLGQSKSCDDIEERAAALTVQSSTFKMNAGNQHLPQKGALDELLASDSER